MEQQATHSNELPSYDNEDLLFVATQEKLNFFLSTTDQSALAGDQADQAKFSIRCPRTGLCFIDKIAPSFSTLDVTNKFRSRFHETILVNALRNLGICGCDFARTFEQLAHADE